MSDLIVVGLSHHTAPVELREQLSVQERALSETLQRIVSQGFSEAVVLSTCNRFEVYGTCIDVGAVLQGTRAYFNQRATSPHLDTALYTRRGEDAVRHAFRVAASLDSMVVGEPQILGQFKQAYDAALDAGTVGTLLGRCFTRAFAVAKRVRNETSIAEGTVSISSIATALARKIFGDLSGRRVLLLGAGEMGEAAAKSLATTGAKLVVMNRSAAKAEQLAANCDGQARGYEHLASELVNADVVITSTSATNYVLSADLMRDVVRARRLRPLFLIDIAVPRDVDPRVGDMENIFLYTVDDLQQVAAENLQARRQAADAAERIVNVEVREFEAWRRSLDLTPTIVGLRERFASVVQAELERTVPRLSQMSSKDRKLLEAMSTAIVNKLLHQPLSALKDGGNQPDGAQLIAAARRLFDLKEESVQEAEHAEMELKPATTEGS